MPRVCALALKSDALYSSAADTHRSTGLDTYAQLNGMAQFMVRVRRMHPALYRSEFWVAFEGDYNPLLGRAFQKTCADMRTALGVVHMVHGVAKDPLLPVVMKGNKTPAYVQVTQVAGRTGRLAAAEVIEQSGKDAGDPAPLMERLVNQARQYRLCVRKPGKDRVRSTQDPRYSGKESGPDDLFVAWLTAMHALVMWMIKHRGYIIPGMTLVPGVRDAQGPTISAIEADMEYAATLKIPDVAQAIARMRDGWLDPDAP